MNYNEEEFARQIQKEREELRKKQQQYLESLKQQREEEKKKKEKEEEFREKERIASEKRQLELLQAGWTIKHKAIWQELCNDGLDPRQVTSIDLTGQREIKYRQLLSEFLNLPLELGDITLTPIEHFKVHAFGVDIDILKENNQWTIKYDYKFVPHPIKLILNENKEPVALESHINNPLFPEMPLKAVLKLKK